MTRDSFISTSTSTSYPSTNSSFDRSALGLTESPLPPLPRSRHSTTRYSESDPSQAQSAPPSPWQRRRTTTPRAPEPSRPVQPTRPSTQSPSRQLQAHHSAPSVPQRHSNHALRPSHSTNSLQAVAEETVLGHRKSSENVGQQPRRTVVKQRSNLSEPTTPSRPTSANEATRKREGRSTPTQHSTPTATVASGRPIAIPVRWTQPAEDTPTPTRSRSVTSKTRPQATRRPSKQDTDESMAQAWETELLRNTENLHLDDSDGLRQHREELRKKDREWETSGMWEDQQDAARKAEERTRREASREIAYPPMQPRAPIRAAPSGVTSVHIGVRPRVHPSRADESLGRNQPDPSLDAPLFSPHAGEPATLSGNTVKGSYNSRYTTELLDKAKAEYEAWLARKSEREGGVGEDHGSVRDFVPRDWSVALPRAVGGQQPLEGWDEPKRSGKSAVSSDESNVATPLEGGFPLNDYGYPPSQPSGDAIDPSQAYGYPEANMQIPPGWTQDDVARWYAAQQAYWNPYWWGQGMQGMPGMQDGQMTDSGGKVTEAADDPKAGTGKVHFANSPDKTRVKKMPSNASIQQDYSDQGIYPDP